MVVFSRLVYVKLSYMYPIKLKSKLSSLLLLILLSNNKYAFAQSELGLTRQAILNLPWIQKQNSFSPLPDVLRVKTDTYHYTFRFTTLDICDAVTLESRSHRGDLMLRDYLNNNATQLSSSTYIFNSNNKDKRFYAFIGITRNDLPRQVIYSKRQMFNTDATPRVDNSPY